MPTTVIIYGTNSSNTYCTSILVADELRSLGFEAKVIPAVDATPLDLKPADLVIFGSCTWSKMAPDGHELQGQLQELFEGFVERLKGQQFLGKKFAVFGLGDSRYTQFCAAATKLEQLVKDIGGKQIGESLRLDGPPHRQEATIKAWAKNIAQAYQAD